MNRIYLLGNNLPWYPKYFQDFPNKNLRKRSIAFPGYGYGSKIYDPINSFKNARVIYLSDLTIYRECPFYPTYGIDNIFGSNFFFSKIFLSNSSFLCRRRTVSWTSWLS